MEIIAYISPTDGFTHYIVNNSMGLPFILWVLIIFGCVSLIHCILSKLLGLGN